MFAVDEAKQGFGCLGSHFGQWSPYPAKAKSPGMLMPTSRAVFRTPMTSRLFRGSRVSSLTPL